MKKFTYVLCAAALLVGLTGCNVNRENPGDHSDSENSSELSNSTANSGGTENSNETNSSDESGNKLGEEALKLLNELTVTSFEGPDGVTVQAEDASDIYDSGNEIFIENDPYHGTTSTVLKYDFAYIRSARPYFYFSEKYPDDEQDAKLRAESEKLPACEWVKVKAGDKLGCGLTVKSAEYLHNPINYLGNALNKMEIEFDGELTMEGILSVNIQDHDYFFSAGDIEFIPDTIKTEGVPVLPFDYWFTYSGLDDVYRAGFGNGYVESDIGSSWLLGNIRDNDDIVTDEIMGGGDAARVKITLKNIRGLVYNDPISFPYVHFYAEIEDVEKI